MIRWLLDHNPHRRPSAQALLQSEYIPPKMEDKELLEVCLVVWVRMFWRLAFIGGASHVVGVGMGLLEMHLMWLGWRFICQEYISCSWGRDGSVGGSPHGVGMGMGLLEVHLMWLACSLPSLQVLTRTLSSTNSTSYQRLMAELFCQSVPIAKGFAYFYDLQEVSGAALTSAVPSRMVAQW